MMLSISQESMKITDVVLKNMIMKTTYRNANLIVLKLMCSAINLLNSQLSYTLI